MPKKLYRLLLLCLSMNGAPFAQADIKVAVEPYIGYSQFSYKTDDDSGTNSDRKMGTILGGKGGVLITDKTWTALDFHFGGPYLLDENDNEYLNKLWGVGFGVINSGGQRLWLGYYPYAKIEDLEHNQSYKGTAYKLSLGKEFKSKLSVNFDYVHQNITQTETSESLPAGLNVSVVFLSLSSPLYLF
jgi:hypothetical protein